MPLWMQPLIQGGILQNPTDGDGNDLGGGLNDDPNDDPNEDPNDDPNDDPNEDPSHNPQNDQKKKSKPTDKEAQLLKEVMKRKENEQKLKNELNDLKVQIGDLNLEEVKKLLQERKDQETRDLEARGEFDRVKQRMADEHKAEVAKLQQKIDEMLLSDQSRELQINNLTIGTNFSQSLYVKDELTLTPTKARALYGAHFELENGQVVGYDKPKGSAQRTQLVDSYGNPLSFDEAMKKIIEADPERDALLRSKIKQGGAGSQNKGDRKAPPSVENLSSREKIAIGLKNL